MRTKSVMAGRIHRAAGAGAHDRRDLRHHARGQRVAKKDVGVAGQRRDALLDAGAAGVVQPDHRRAHAHGHIHDLDDLRRIGQGERAAEDGEILREDEHQPALDASVAGDEAVAVNLLLLHAEIGAAMGEQLVGLFEGAFVEQEGDALARRHLAFLVLALVAFLAPAGFGQAVALLQFFQLLFQSHAGNYKDDSGA